MDFDFLKREQPQRDFVRIKVRPPARLGSIEFFVKASVAIGGTFDKWDATLTFTSPDVTTPVLDVKIQADSVSTGSDMKNKKLEELAGPRAEKTGRVKLKWRKS